jgi:hypothetical protein
MVRPNMIKNWNVTPNDINNALKFFGEDIATLRGETARISQDTLMADYVEIPKEIIYLNRELKVAADLLFVNGLPFVTSISRNVKFTTIEHVTNRSEPNLIKSLLNIVSRYKAQGFTPSTALMDHKF